MKAWKDLKDSGKDLFKTDSSEWWLDLGAKIELFDSGRIEIWNTISPGFNYTKPTLDQMMYFEDYGWDAGRFKICVDEYERRLEDLKKRMMYISGDEEIASANRCYERYVAKIKEYKIKVEKAISNN